MSTGLYSGASGLALGFGLYRATSGLWGGASGLIAGFGGASLYLDFLTMTAPTFDSRITFSRGSNATLTDSTGKITYAPANLLTYSDGTVANLSTNGGVTNAAAPISNYFVNSIQFGDNSVLRYAYKAANTIASNIYLFSIYVKMNSGSSPDVGTTNSTGDFGVVVEGNLVSSASTVTAVGDGVYRVSYKFTAAGGGFPNFGVVKYTSQSANQFAVTGYQLEPVTYQTTPSTYQATTSTAYYGPRFDYDPVTLAAKGLLIEEQRTNLFTYSADITNAAWSKNNTTTTADATTAPDGTTTADKLAETATTAVHNAGRSITTTAQAYTFYCYIKAAERNFALLYHTQSNASVSVNLTTGATGTASGTVAPTSSSVTSVGNGWWRVAMTVTATAASNFFGVYVMNDLVNASYAGTAGSGIYVWGAQLEAGAFATSYIPTVASTVTRSADVATMTGANFSSWYNGAAGTFVVSADSYAEQAGGNAYNIVSANDGTAANFIRSYVYAATAGETVRTANVTVADINRSAWTQNIAFKLASTYASNDFIAALNGSLSASDTSGAVPTVTQLSLGNNNNAGSYLNGHIRTLAYYNTRLPNSQLQTLTAPSLAQTLSLDFINGNYNVGF